MPTSVYVAQKIGKIHQKYIDNQHENRKKGHFLLLFLFTFQNECDIINIPNRVID